MLTKLTPHERNKKISTEEVKFQEKQGHGEDIREELVLFHAYTIAQLLMQLAQETCHFFNHGRLVL